MNKPMRAEDLLMWLLVLTLLVGNVNSFIDGLRITELQKQVKELQKRLPHE